MLLKESWRGSIDVAPAIGIKGHVVQSRRVAVARARRGIALGRTQSNRTVRTSPRKTRALHQLLRRLRHLDWPAEGKLSTLS